MKTYEMMSNAGAVPRPHARSTSSAAFRWTERGARPRRRRVLILAAVLWTGLFGLELVALPPWGRGAHPAAPTHTAALMLSEAR